MSTPPAPSPAPPPRRRRLRTWIIAIVALIAVVSTWAYYIREQRTKHWLAMHETLRRQVHYEARTFPAKVTFQRGPARAHELYKSQPWRGVAMESATCPDDSEGMEFAEFYQSADTASLVSRPFADETHPDVHRQLEKFFGHGAAASILTKAVVLHDSTVGPWKIRTTFVPTPYGSNVVPENLPRSLHTQLSVQSVPTAPKLEKVVADPRHYSGGTPGRSYTGKTRQQAQREADQKAERDYKRARESHDNRHHHFYLVEAVRDFGEGRIVVLRRFGQVYGATTITRAVGIIQAMAQSLVLSESPKP